MIIRFSMFENECFVPNNSVSLEFIGTSKDSETNEVLYEFIAHCKSIADVAIKCADGTIKRIRSLVMFDGYNFPDEWYYSFF